MSNDNPATVILAPVSATADIEVVLNGGAFAFSFMYGSVTVLTSTVIIGSSLDFECLQPLD